MLVASLAILGGFILLVWSADRFVEGAAATAETTISGADVPKPTMTIPINKDGIPACLAVAAAPSTKRSTRQTRGI